jgi:hypothetical protein
MERMGHSSVQVTLGTYGHLLPGIDEQLTSGLKALGRQARERVRGARSVFVGSRLGHARVTAIPATTKKSR